MHVALTRMQRSLEGENQFYAFNFQFPHCRSPTGSGRDALLAKSWHSSPPSLSWHKRSTLLFEFGTFRPLVFLFEVSFSLLDVAGEIIGVDFILSLFVSAERNLIKF